MPLTASAAWAAVILAGGRGERLGRVAKAQIELGGRTLLSWALEATAAATATVVVGEPTSTTRPVTFTREQPRYGGPVAGLLAGLDALATTDPPPYLAVLAVDMPRVSADTLARLRASIGEHDGAILVDPDGRRQLALVVATDRLEQVRPDPDQCAGMPMRRLLAGLRLTEVPGHGEEHLDVDSWADLHALG